MEQSSFELVDCIESAAYAISDSVEYSMYSAKSCGTCKSSCQSCGGGCYGCKGSKSSKGVEAPLPRESKLIAAIEEVLD